MICRVLKESGKQSEKYKFGLSFPTDILCMYLSSPRIIQKLIEITIQGTTHFLHTFGLAFVILILNLNLNFAVLKLLKLLVDGDGDVERSDHVQYA